MKRFKLTVAYDGTNYCGWQIQPGAPTVEGELNKALKQLTGEEIQVIGASRTDAGVHAYGNVAVFDTNARMPAEKISYALNQRLPEDIVVQNSCEVPPDWHPRHCNSRKTYEYRILNREFPMPQRRLDTWFVYRKLNIPAMCEAARRFEGTHDFKSFCSVNTAVEDTTRTIYSCELEQQGDLLTIRVTGSGFLYNMVRIIAGTLFDVGIGKIAPEDIPAILEKKDRKAAGPTAPAHGLTMIGLEYEILPETLMRPSGKLTEK